MSDQEASSLREIRETAEKGLRYEELWWIDHAPSPADVLVLVEVAEAACEYREAMQVPASTPAVMWSGATALRRAAGKLERLEAATARLDVALARLSEGERATTGSSGGSR